MLKKVFVLFMASAMLLSATACGQKGDSDSGVSAASPSGATASQEGTKGKDYSEHITISYAAVGMGEGVDYNADDLSKHFTEKFNIEWDPIVLTWDNWGEKNRIWINSNDMPDFSVWDFKYGDYVNYAEQGLIRKLPDGWKEKWPNMAEVYKNTGIADALEERMGAAYMIPRIIYFNKPTDPLVGNLNLWMRKDWATEVGFPIKDKYTTKEVMEYARLVKEKDPVGNKKTIGIDINFDNLMNVFVKPYNVNCSAYYKGEDGKYRWGAADETTLEGLRLYSEAYKNGLINADFFALKNNEYIANYQSGISAAIYQGGFGRVVLNTSELYETNSGGNADTDLHMAYLVSEDGLHHTEEIANFWTASIFSPKMSDEKFERLMDVLEYSASEEGQNLTRMGFEGKEWERDAAGEITITREKDETGKFVSLDKAYPSLDPLYNNLTVLPDNFGLTDPGLSQSIRDLVNSRFDGKQKDGCDAGVVKPIDWDMYFYTSPAYEKTKFNIGEEFAKLVVMGGDIEANWRAWVAEKKPQVDLVLGEINEKLGK